MKKILASLLSLVMLISSVEVFCSADNNENISLTNETTVVNEESVTNNGLAIETPVTNEETLEETKGVEFSLETLKELYKNIVEFCNDHQKELSIVGIVTATVSVVGTTAYIFRNEIKNLAQKTAKAVKNVFEKKQEVKKI